MLALLNAFLVLAAPDAGTPRVLLGEQFGVPVYAPDIPWTRDVPAAEGGVELAGATRSTSNNALRFTAERVALTGTASLELATKPLPARRVTVRFKVDQGKVRVFLKYALDVAVFCEASAPATCTLEGLALKSPASTPEVRVQSLEGAAVLRDFSATTP